MSHRKMHEHKSRHRTHTKKPTGVVVPLPKRAEPVDAPAEGPTPDAATVEGPGEATP